MKLFYYFAITSAYKGGMGPIFTSVSTASMRVSQKNSVLPWSFYSARGPVRVDSLSRRSLVTLPIRPLLIHGEAL